MSSILQWVSTAIGRRTDVNEANPLPVATIGGATGATADAAATDSTGP